MPLDYLIVGHGLAGATLAHTLINKGKSVLVIDPDPETSSSKIAAGVFNPIVVKRVTKSWQADDFFPFARNFYTSLEDKWQMSFFHERRLARVLGNVQEQNNWHEKMGNPGLSDYLSDETIEEINNGPFNIPYGYAVVKQTGNLNILAFLAASRKQLEITESVVTDSVQYDSIQITDHEVAVGKYTAKKIIFCEGHYGAGNPWFSYLPFSLTKGEVLTLKSDVKLNTIVNRKVFILPIGNGLFKCGSTFDWRNLDEKSTDQGKEEILQKLRLFYKGDFDVVFHKAAIRPTVKDRRPLLGVHPRHSNLIIFNGLGTKGVSYAPWLANNLVNHLENGLPLHPEADIKRYQAHWPNTG